MELLPCPCCGWPAEMRRLKSGDDFAKCTNPSCGLRTKNCHEDVNGPVAIWNSRAKVAD